MYRLTRFRPEEKECHLWVTNATEHFVRHFGRDFRKEPIADQNGRLCPIESPKVTCWFTDEDHLEGGWMENRSPQQIKKLQEIFCDTVIKRPVAIQAVLPGFTECFYAYTIQPKDAPHQRSTQRQVMLITEIRWSTHCRQQSIDRYRTLRERAPNHWKTGRALPTTRCGLCRIPQALQHQ